MDAPAPHRVDVGDDDFEQEVVSASHEVPVVVDFWAPWCGPCRSLGPLLERLAEEHEGAFRLAKVNVDLAPQVAQHFGVRSIPFVVGFRDGVPVSQFVGAQPEPTVRAFLMEILPSAADQAVEEAAALRRDGQPDAARARYQAVLADDPRHPGALLGLAELLSEANEPADALACLEQISAAAAEAPAAEQLAAVLRTRGGSSEDEAELSRRIEADPQDLGARLALGRALAARQDFEPALEALLGVVERDRSFADEAARKAMLDVFQVLGSDHPLCERYRAALARVLFR